MKIMLTFAEKKKMPIIKNNNEAVVRWALTAVLGVGAKCMYRVNMPTSTLTSGIFMWQDRLFRIRELKQL